MTKSEDPCSREALKAKAQEYRDLSGAECDRWHQLRTTNPYKGGGPAAEKAFETALKLFRETLPKETDFSGQGAIPLSNEKLSDPRVPVRFDVLLGLQAELAETRWRYFQAEAIAREWEIAYLNLSDKLKKD